MSLTKLPLGRNKSVYDVIIPAQGEFGSDIPAGDGKLAILFYGVVWILFTGWKKHIYKKINFACWFLYKIPSAN
jgi:hypothetical protein